MPPVRCVKSPVLAGRSQKRPPCFVGRHERESQADCRFSWHGQRGRIDGGASGAGFDSDGACHARRGSPVAAAQSLGLNTVGHRGWSGAPPRGLRLFFKQLPANAGGAPLVPSASPHRVRQFQPDYYYYEKLSLLPLGARRLYLSSGLSLWLRAC